MPKVCQAYSAKPKIIMPNSGNNSGDNLTQGQIDKTVKEFLKQLIEGMCCCYMVDNFNVALAAML